MEEESYIGKLFRVKRSGVYLRSNFLHLNKEDLLLCVFAEKEETAAATWRREMKILYNGQLFDIFLTDFKRLIRQDEVEEVRD